MFEEIKNRKANLGFVWTKAVDTGATFLCPADRSGDLSSLSEDELRHLCVDESANPQND